MKYCEQIRRREKDLRGTNKRIQVFCVEVCEQNSRKENRAFFNNVLL